MNNFRNLKRYEVEGMHCVSCALLIEDELETSGYAKNAKCNYATSELIIESQDQIDDKKVMEILSKLGYKVTPNN